MAFRPFLGSKPLCSRHFERADFLRGEDVSPSSYLHPGRPSYPFLLRYVVQNLSAMVGPTRSQALTRGPLLLIGVAIILLTQYFHTAHVSRHARRWPWDVICHRIYGGVQENKMGTRSGPYGAAHVTGV